MAIRQTLIATALPNGVTGSGADATLRLSVFLSSRLWTDEAPRPTLASFPGFLDWPATSLAFSAQFASGPRIPAARTGAPPSSQLWRALFPDDTFVRPREFQAALLSRSIRSYPVANVLAFLQERYVALVEAGGDEFPDVQSLLGPAGFGPITYQPTNFAGLAALGPEEAALRQELETLLLANLALAPGPSDPQRDFLQVRLFHERRGQQRVPLAVPDLDFHQALSAMGDYPPLLRRLGIVHDLELPLSAAGPLGPTTVQVLVEWQPGAVATDIVPNPLGGASPRHDTRCILGPAEFIAAPRQASPDIADGALRLDDQSTYSVFQVDHDGAALKAGDFASNVQRSVLNQTTDTPQRFAALSLRTAGISVARTGQAGHTRARWNRDLSRDQAASVGRRHRARS